MINEIKKELEKGTLVFGYKETIKLLSTSKASKVFYATNIEESKKEELIKYAEMNGIKAEEAGLPNDELGTACKKTFAISALAVKK